MSLARVPLANYTNSYRSNTRSSPSFSFPSKLASRKSPPTCTVSLESVSCNNQLINTSILICSSPSFSISNMVPFPSPPSLAEEPRISQPNPTSLMVLDASPEPNRKTSRASSSPAPPERRKRVTSRLLRPPQLAEPKGCPDCKAQPPRKRPRLQKKASPSKRTASYSHSDLRFLAVVQRDIASRVKEQRDWSRSRRFPPLDAPQLHSFEAQDALLASRLGSMLLDCGFKDSDVVSLDEDQMDVDDEISFSLPGSIGLDPNVDATARSSPFTPPSPLLRSPSTSSSLDKPTSRENLVPTLLLRHHTRKLARSNERIGASRESPKKSSPLVNTVL